MKLPSIVMSLAGCAALAACGNSGSVPATAAASSPAPAAAVPAAAPAHASSVAWFEGSVDAAFAKAQSDHKPVLMLWGAVWCPYCEALKATVFTRADVAAQTANMIPVYLDGDTPEGQAAVDQFKVIGYPTLIVFKPDRTEIARVSGGMDLEQYAGTLARVLEDERPIAEVLAAATVPAGAGGAAPISSADCQRLAYYGWDLDAEPDDAAQSAASRGQGPQGQGSPGVSPGAAAQNKASQLATAAERCPPTEHVARARLTARALVFAVQQESDALEKGQAASPQVVAQLQALLPVLANRDDARAVVDILSLVDDATFAAVKGQGQSFADTFHKAWTNAMLTAAHDSHYGESERLLALATAIDAETQLRKDQKAPADMANEARKQVAAALSKDSQQATRHDIVNAARLVYSTLGDNDALYELLVAEAPKSKSGYYYMPSIASIEEKRGHAGEALKWLKRAYESTQSPGARAKYGARYVAGLTRLAPDDLATIRVVSMEVAQALNERDARTTKASDRADHLTDPLTKWATTPPRKAVVADVEKRLTSV